MYLWCSQSARLWKKEVDRRERNYPNESWVMNSLKALKSKEGVSRGKVEGWELEEWRRGGGEGGGEARWNQSLSRLRPRCASSKMEGSFQLASSICSSHRTHKMCHARGGTRLKWLLDSLEPAQRPVMGEMAWILFWAAAACQPAVASSTTEGQQWSMGRVEEVRGKSTFCAISAKMEKLSSVRSSQNAILRKRHFFPQNLNLLIHLWNIQSVLFWPSFIIYWHYS